jgi:hypothetical protein
VLIKAHLNEGRYLLASNLGERIEQEVEEARKNIIQKDNYFEIFRESREKININKPAAEKEKTNKSKQKVNIDKKEPAKTEKTRIEKVAKKGEKQQTVKKSNSKDNEEDKKLQEPETQEEKKQEQAEEKRAKEKAATIVKLKNMQGEDEQKQKPSSDDKKQIVIAVTKNNSIEATKEKKPPKNTHLVTKVLEEKEKNKAKIIREEIRKAMQEAKERQVVSKKIRQEQRRRVAKANNRQLSKRSIAKRRTFQQRLATRVSLDLEDVEIKDVLRILAEKGDLNIIANETLSGKVTLHLTETTIKDTIELVLSSQGVTYKIIDNTIVVAQEQDLQMSQQMVTRIIKFNNLEPESIEEIIKTYLNEEESVTMIDNARTVLVKADHRKIDYIEKLCRKIDEQKVPQVVLIAQIMEISSTDLRRFGLTWPPNATIAFEGESLNAMEPVLSISSMVINALQEEGKAKILASPQIKALNGEKAEIFIGDKIPYVELTTDTTGRLTESVKYADTGIELTILPIINPRTEEVKLKIEPEVSYVNGYRGRNNDIPILRTRKVVTTVWVKHGEMAIIGGLFNSSDAKTGSQVPLLGDIPLIGNLFKGTRDEDTQTELVITVTPKIMK